MSRLTVAPLPCPTGGKDSEAAARCSVSKITEPKNNRQRAACPEQNAKICAPAVYRMFTNKMKTNHQNLVILALAGARLPAASVTLHPVADTTLQEAFPNNKSRGRHQLPSWRTAAGRQGARPVRFRHCRQRAAGATINSVTLSLNVVAVALWRCQFHFRSSFGLQSWGEGNGSDHGGSAAGAGQATWNNRSGRHAVDYRRRIFLRDSLRFEAVSGFGIIRSVPLLKWSVTCSPGSTLPRTLRLGNSTARANSRPQHPPRFRSPRQFGELRQPHRQLHARAGAGHARRSGAWVGWSLAGLPPARARRGKIRGWRKLQAISRISPTRPMRHRQGRFMAGRCRLRRTAVFRRLALAD